MGEFTAGRIQAIEQSKIKSFFFFLMAHYLIFPSWSGCALTKKHINKIKSLKIKYVNNVL